MYVITTAGQGLGGMHTVSEVLWLDDYTQDAMPILVAVGNRPPDEPMYIDVQTTTPAPERGEFKECVLLCSCTVSRGRKTLSNCDFEITFVPS